MENAPKKTIAEVMRENKTVFIIIAVVLFLLELEIFAIAAMKSGKKSWLQVLDHDGNLIHETDGKSLSDFNKYYFEKTFGPFENYRVKLVTQERPFPFRGWFFAAVGIPLGIILMFAFIIKAYSSLFYGNEDYPLKNISDADNRTHFEKIIASVSRFSIFTTGFLIFLALFLYWVLPNFFMYIGKTGLETFDRYKWIFISLGVALVGIVMWVIYLKYLLARRTIDSHTELAKYRLQLEMNPSSGQPRQVTYHRDISADNRLGWEAAEKKEEPGTPYNLID